ncbi:MAG: hypothetical protein KTR31_36095 [Myxococcales bacterium]|nr:hypothetical protein [Myxococcales bacterium]
MAMQVGFTAASFTTAGTTATADTGGTTTGDTGSATTTPTPTSFQVEDMAGNLVTIDGGNAAIRDIEIDLPSGQTCGDLDPTFAFESPVRCEDGEDKIEIVGPFLVDLVTREATPSLAGLTIPPGTYERVDIRFDPGASGSGVSLAMAGTIEDISDPVAFELALEINEDARFESPDGIEVDASEDMFAQIDLDVVFRQTLLGSCARSLADGGVAQIDNESDCGDDLEDAIEDAIKETFDLD